MTAPTMFAITAKNILPCGGRPHMVLVDLDEGPRMMSRVDGIAPQAVQIGMRVKARIVASDTGPFVVFDPA